MSYFNIIFILSFYYRLLVGAPSAESGQPGVSKGGAVYKCQPRQPGSCEQIPFDTKGKNKCHPGPSFNRVCEAPTCNFWLFEVFLLLLAKTCLSTTAPPISLLQPKAKNHILDLRTKSSIIQLRTLRLLNQTLIICFKSVHRKSFTS